MKTIFFTLTMALIAFGAFGTTSSYAHCGVCEASEAGHAKKPCTKCVDAKKACKCGKEAGKPCEKTMGEKKPCEKTMGKKKPCNKKGYRSMKDHSGKGSLTIRSGSPEAGRYN